MELIQLVRLGRDAPAVVPEAGEVVCALCGDGERLTFVVIGHADTAVCVDSRACVERALTGVSV